MSPVSLVNYRCVGSALAFAASALWAHAAYAQGLTQGGLAAAPDTWLINSGTPWHHRVSSSATPRTLKPRAPEGDEIQVVELAKAFFPNSNVKAMALVSGDEVVWQSLKSPVQPDSHLFGFSLGKTVTAMAVGKAICANAISLDQTLSQAVPELGATDLGKAKVRDLLTMTSGVWEGNSDSTIWSADQAKSIAAGQMDWLELLGTPRVSSAASDLTGKHAPGKKFSYKSTDPLALGILLARTTGKSYAQWTAQEVLHPAGVTSPVVIAQDKAKGYGQADAGVRMTFGDWIRFASWVRQSENEPGCFGDFVREAVKPQVDTGKPSPLTSYGYLTWTNGSKSWALGHGGQRIAWNRKNARILVAFSNLESTTADLAQIYERWSALP